VTGGLNNNYQYGIGTAFNPSGDGTSPAVSERADAGTECERSLSERDCIDKLPNQVAGQCRRRSDDITGGTLFQGAYYPTLYTNTSSYPVDQPITFNALVTNSSGTPLSNIPVTLYVTGANPGQYQATTDSTGTAAFMYSGLYEGTDSLLAQAFPSGQSGIVSGQASITWTNFPTPPPVGSLTFTDDRIYGPDNEQGFIVAATDASGSPVFDANVGFYVWGANNYSASGMTDVNGEVPFTFEHNPGAWNAVAVDSVGRTLLSPIRSVVCGHRPPHLTRPVMRLPSVFRR